VDSIFGKVAGASSSGMGSGARGATVTGNATQLPDSFNVGGHSVTTAGPAGMDVRSGSFPPAVTTWRYDNPCQLAVTDTNHLPPANPTGTVSYTVSAPVTVGTLVARRRLNSNSQPSAFHRDQGCSAGFSQLPASKALPSPASSSTSRRRFTPVTSTSTCNGSSSPDRSPDVHSRWSSP